MLQWVHEGRTPRGSGTMERTLSTKEAEEILGRYDALASLGLKADLAEVTEDIASLVATIRALRKEQPDE